MSEEHSRLRSQWDALQPLLERIGPKLEQLEQIELRIAYLEQVDALVSLRLPTSLLILTSSISCFLNSIADVIRLNNCKINLLYVDPFAAKESALTLLLKMLSEPSTIVPN